MIKVAVADPAGIPAEVTGGGLHVKTEPIARYYPKNVFLVNSLGSPVMNVNGAATGATDGVHDGTDSTLWTATSVSGTWDFASTAQAAAGTKSIDATSVINGSAALLTRGTSVSASDWSVLTGEIYLTEFNASKNVINLIWRLAGVEDGISINLGDHIDEGITNAWQSFQIEIENFNAANGVDELLISIISNGTPPAFYLDEVDLRAGGGETYGTSLAPGKVFEYKWIDVFMTDAYTGITTVSGSTENATMPGLSYDKFLGLSELSVGVVFQRTVFDEVITSGSVRNLLEIMQGGARIMSVISDGTNTTLHMRIEFPEWVTLSEVAGDDLTATINDDMTGLIDFKSVLVGREIL